MAELNVVFLMGNLTRDPEVRNTSGGGVVCAFGLAMNRRYSTAQGEDREETCFVDIEAWGRQAETCANYLRKGAPALVEGRLRLDRWEDRDSGAPRSRLLVQARRVQFLRAPAEGSREPTPRPPQEDRPATRDQPEPKIPPFEPVTQDDDDIPF